MRRPAPDASWPGRLSAGGRQPPRFTTRATVVAFAALAGLGATSCTTGPSAPASGPAAATAAVQVSPPPVPSGGATGPSLPPSGLPAELTGPTWQLTGFDTGTAITEAIEGHPPTLRFGGGGLAGNGGCNSFSAAVEAEAPTGGAGRLEVSGIAVTQMACVETALNEQEARFLEALGRVTRFRLVDARSLVLEDDTGRAGLLFRDAAAAP